MEALRKEISIDLIDADNALEENLDKYDIIGLASGIYMGKCHKNILNFIEKSTYLTNNRKLFLMLTSGSNGSKYGKHEKKLLENRGCNVLGLYKCKGFDTYGIYKYIGGIAKGHPNSKDIENAVTFIKNL